MSVVGHPRRFAIVEDGKELLEDLGVLLFLVAVAGTVPCMDFTRPAAALINFGDGRRLTMRREQFSHGRGDVVGITHVKLFNLVM